MSSVTNFLPVRQIVSSVTNSTLGTVTTVDDHGYFVGQVIRLIVPGNYGMEIDYQQVKILTIPTSNSFTCDYDTTQLSPFVIPSPLYQVAQTVPMTGVEVNFESIVGIPQ